MLATDIPVLVFLVAQILFVVAAVIFAISSIDDLLHDGFFFLSALVRKKHDLVPESVSRYGLLQKPEQYLAIMLPAWQEANIIEPAVKNLIATLDYEKYVVFIGVYPNDAETNKAVDNLVAALPRVVKVVTPLPGPTCKADCLNSIVKRIFAHETKHQLRFAAVVMQDAEDVVHPLSLRLFNWLVPDADLVQIPVFSLPRKLSYLTGGHYMDEFVEVHSKDIKVREWFAGIVPGAGVGTAYSRRALLTAGEGGEIFATNSLTEDYEFSLRLKDAGLRQVFAKVRVEDSSEPAWGRKAKSYIATQEFFPSAFWAAVRQKTRWTIGISMQGWKNFGWRGSWRIKYLFWRDRKMLAFSHAILLGYLSILLFIGVAGYEAVFNTGYRLRPIIPDGHFLWRVIWFNLIFLGYRVAQRHYWTYHHYGLVAAFMVLPRYIWGAVINYFALCRAIKIFGGHLLFGTKIGWDKTTHEFPDFEGGSSSGAAAPKAA